MKILKGYTVKMNFYDDGKVSWEVFTDGQLINFGTSLSEKRAKKTIKATFKSLDKNENSMV
jgi:hypothetical protein